MKKILLARSKMLTLACLLLAFCTSDLYGQNHDHEKCRAATIYQRMMENNPAFQRNRAAIKRHIEAYQQSESVLNEVVTIPTVFHVIHNGETEGNYPNINDDLICAQLDQLNDDFRAMNANIGDVLPEFQDDIGDMLIQFCFAAIDPDGNATDGIMRYDFDQNVYTEGDFENEIKPMTIWDRDQYFNIWTAELSGGLLGYAQFPGGDADTDGIVNLASSIGSIDMPSPNGGNFNLGRTVTHEAGHFFDLFHIWGDDLFFCTGSDQVDDTPNQGGSTAGCPTGTRASCSSNDMYQNYMDYTDDACMALFSQGQATRSQATVDVGGFRRPLATSTIPCTSCGDVTPPTCDDGIQNGLETGVDCGGPDCPACPPTCDDGIQNGDEEGIDCGGSNCPPCMMEPTCDDGIQNGLETGVDCGGPDCPPCMMETCDAPTGLFETNNTGTSVTLNWTAVTAANTYTVQGRQAGTNPWRLTQNSNSNSTTISNNIVNGVTYEWRVRSNCDDGNSEYSEIATFTAGDTGGGPTCDDGIQNGLETGVDCGGPDCPPCMMEPTCDDGIQNGDEEGVDCGGSVCPPCMMEPTCDDGIQNGDEEGVDCGGPDCPPCMMEPTCDDGIQNGLETGVDCGGPDCPPCMMETCDVPIGLFETNNTGSSVTLNWTAVPAANSYTVQGRQAGTTRWRLNQNSNTNSTIISNNIVAGVTYEWRVRSNCDDGNSEYSEIVTFTAGGSTADGGIENRNGFIIEEVLATKVYPSPTNDWLNVQSNQSISQIQVLDITGKVVAVEATKIGSSRVRLNVSNLAQGHYFVRIQANEDVKTLRFVKQ